MIVSRKKYLLLALLCAAILSTLGFKHWSETSIAQAGLVEVANGDAQFWLMQGAPNNRFNPCTVYYHFDTPLNESVVRARLKDLVESYALFHRNVVEVKGLPYWQPANVDWTQNFRVLDANEDIESVRAQADFKISQASALGAGLPLFRAYLTADRRQLIFIWHHVLSDFEGMFNKHAKHLFTEKAQRTQFGYQTDNKPGSESQPSTPPLNIWASLKNTDKPLGFSATNFEVTKIVLPVKDKILYTLGQQAGLPMSDIFSFITLRAVTRYEENSGQDRLAIINPIVTPISLRKNSLAMDEGNNRAVRQFPFIFPLESVPDMYQRVINLSPTSSSYETAGRLMKIARQFSFMEPALRRIAMPDHISNYFPLADNPLGIGEATLVSHHLRVPMVPFERSKFAWSNYNGQVQLYLHTDPVLIDKERLIASFEQASSEVLGFLESPMP